MKAADKWFLVLLAVTVAVFFYLMALIYMAPTAQEEAGGIAQKIFYFHVPSAYAMYLSGAVCCFASAAYLFGASDRRDAWARAGAECAVVFGALVMTSGPLWAKKAWGVYWTWDPRLTTLLLSIVIYVAIVVLRAFSGDGAAERRFAAALGVLGTANLPIIHYAVKKWGGIHPTVISGSGGGLHADMWPPLIVGFVFMTLLAVVLLWARARLWFLRSRVAAAEERALSLGLVES